MLGIIIVIIIVLAVLFSSPTSVANTSAKIHPLDEVVLEISNPFKNFPALGKEIIDRYPHSRQVKGKAFLDINQENGYYIEFYPSGIIHISSRKTGNFIYTEAYAENGNLFQKAQITSGKLDSFEWYDSETGTVMIGMKHENRIRKVYTTSKLGQIKYLTPEEEKNFYRNIMLLLGIR